MFIEVCVPNFLALQSIANHVIWKHTRLASMPMTSQQCITPTYGAVYPSSNVNPASILLSVKNATASGCATWTGMIPIAFAEAGKIATISADNMEVSTIMRRPHGLDMVLPGGCWSPDGSLLAHCVLRQQPGDAGGPSPHSPFSVVSLVSNPQFS